MELHPLNIKLTEEETKQWHAGKIRVVDCEARCMQINMQRVVNDGFRILGHDGAVLRQHPPLDPLRVLGAGFDRVDPATGVPLTK